MSVTRRNHSSTLILIQMIVSFLLDSCIYGDYLGTFYDGRTCQEVVEQSPWQCYNDIEGGLCCQSCERIRDNYNERKSS